MGQSIVLPPSPKYDQSLLAYLGRLSTTVRDAFRRTFTTGEWQWGTFVATFAAAPSAGILNITFPYTFPGRAGDGPLVVANPVNNPIGTDFSVFIVRSYETGFYCKVDTTLGGAYTGNITVKWAAFYP